MAPPFETRSPQRRGSGRAYRVACNDGALAHLAGSRGGVVRSIAGRGRGGPGRRTVFRRRGHLFLEAKFPREEPTECRKCYESGRAAVTGDPTFANVAPDASAAHHGAARWPPTT